MKKYYLALFFLAVLSVPVFSADWIRHDLISFTVNDVEKKGAYLGHFYYKVELSVNRGNDYDNIYKYTISIPSGSDIPLPDTASFFFTFGITKQRLAKGAQGGLFGLTNREGNSVGTGYKNKAQNTYVLNTTINGRNEQIIIKYR